MKAKPSHIPSQQRAPWSNNMQSEENDDSNTPVSDGKQTQKRKTCGSPGEASGDEDDNSSNVHTSKELHAWADARGIARKTRMKSVTTSMDACVREDVPGKDVLLQVQESLQESEIFAS